MLLGARVSLSKESHVSAESDKARKDPVRTDWDQKHWCEFKIAKTCTCVSVHVSVLVRVCVDVYILVHISYLCLLTRPRSKDTPVAVNTPAIQILILTPFFH